MLRAIGAFAIACLWASGAQASLVYLTGSGHLSSASGAAFVGENFSFRTAFDTQAAVQNDPSIDGLAFYDSLTSQPIIFTIGSVSDADDVLYYNIVSAGPVFSMGPPADYTPKANLYIAFGRTGPSDLSLPSAAELNGKVGTISFYDPRSDPEGDDLSLIGSGSLTVSTVPEPAKWLLLIVGLGLAGWMRRRRLMAAPGYARSG